MKTTPLKRYSKKQNLVPDGAGIVWASGLLRASCREEVPGVALVAQISERAAKREISECFL
jgi:UDP-N-acetyl-D-mannosaminuronic acid transferase (WecB/TagA/CpsF family)